MGQKHHIAHNEKFYTMKEIFLNEHLWENHRARKIKYAIIKQQRINRLAEKNRKRDKRLEHRPSYRFRMNRWRALVLRRDNHVCQLCGSTGTDAHHIYPYKEFFLMRILVSNGVTLCKDCHKFVHSYVGKYVMGIGKVWMLAEPDYGYKWNRK